MDTEAQGGTVEKSKIIVVSKPDWLARGIEICGIVIALAVLFVYSRQLSVMSSQLAEMHGTGLQNSQLISATATQASATKTLAENASKQIEAINRLAFQTKRSADIAQQTLAASAEYDRPWVGMADYSVIDFEVGKRPQLKVIVRNSGRRPAKLIVANFNGNFFTKFPKNPPYQPQKETNYLILPNGDGTLFSEWTGIAQQAEIPTAVSVNRLFLYGNLIYEDIKTKKKYWTHICMYYTPGLRTEHGGWGTCDMYNEAD